MKASRILASTTLIVATGWALHAALAQEPGIKRTDLQRYELSTPGREAIQVVVEFAAGASFPRHSHPGEELVYVINGVLEYELSGQSPVILRAGQVLFIPSGTIHFVKNVGSGTSAELATYIVEKGKPLLQKVE